ncbi:hypothetical protein RRSWK_01263 [Rhodopirellula sp. SWK7]|nr:hypothetical protein RRSWK_01263 [Rhodopirellula sp. SWK7]
MLTRRSPDFRPRFAMLPLFCSLEIRQIRHPPMSWPELVGWKQSRERTMA